MEKKYDSASVNLERNFYNIFQDKIEKKTKVTANIRMNQKR